MQMQNSSTTYGESVKFYEKINQLHGQLKNYEEEQFMLEAEFGRLCTMENRPGSVDTGLTTDYNNATVDANNAQKTSLSTVTKLQVDEMSLEDRRRRRNEEILAKIKELEANASHFAARSERLRIMRSEYDNLVKKYMANRSNKVLPGAKPNPAITSAYSFLNNNSNNGYNAADSKTLVSIGVNTNITIQPVSGSNNRMLDTNEIKANHSRPENYIDEQQIQQEFPFVSSSTNAALMAVGHSDGTSNNNDNNNYAHLINQYTGTDLLLNKSLMNERFRITTRAETEKNAVADSKKVFSDYSKSQTQMMTIESDGENEGKLHHNHYFDLSTTSESELTSLGVSSHKNKKNKPIVNIPINFSLDDTTQSDNTISLSVSMPSKLEHNGSSKKLRGSYQLQQVPSLTTTTSETSTVHTAKNHQKQQKQKNETNKKYRMIQVLQEKVEEEEDARMGITRRIPVEPENAVEVGRGAENAMDIDNDLDISEGLTTSPGDSVMDSVQNRTLNESLPRDVLDTTAATITMAGMMRDELTEKMSSKINKYQEEKTLEYNQDQKHSFMNKFLVSDVVEKKTIEDKDKDDEKAENFSTPMTKTEIDAKIERTVTGMENASSRRPSLILSERGESITNVQLHDDNSGGTHRNYQRVVESSTTTITTAAIKSGETNDVEKVKPVDEDAWENNTITLENKSKPSGIVLDVKKLDEKHPKESRDLPVVTEISQKVTKELPPAPTKVPSSQTSASRRVRIRLDDYDDSDSDSVQQAVVNPSKNDGDFTGTKPQLVTATGNGGGVGGKDPVDITDDDDSFFD